MISRYALYDTTQLEARFGLTSGLPKGVRPHYNVSPTMDEPVIVRKDGTTAIVLMKWGLVANGSKDMNSVFRYKTFNVPSEKILSKHSWEQAVRHTRCLVPANGFYVLPGGKDLSRRAHFVQAKDKSILALAGIHSVWKDAAGVEHQTYSIITIEAEQDMKSLAERLPIVIHRDEESQWLDETATDANSLYGMFRSYDVAQLVAVEVGDDIYSSKIDKPELIVPRSPKG